MGFPSAATVISRSPGDVKLRFALFRIKEKTVRTRPFCLLRFEDLQEITQTVPESSAKNRGKYQDSYIATENGTKSLVAVLDGHGEQGAKRSTGEKFPMKFPVRQKSLRVRASAAGKESLRQQGVRKA